MQNIALRFFTYDIIDKLNKNALWVPFNPQTGSQGKFYSIENDERSLMLKPGNSVYEYSGQDYNFGTHNFTLCFWLKYAEAFQNNDGSISPNHVIFNLDNDKFDYIYNPDTEWHHYAFVRIKGVVRFYLDGKLIKTLDSPEDFNLNTTSYVYIGCSLGHMFGDVVYVDDLYLFSTALWNTPRFDVPTLYMPTDLYYYLYTTSVENYGMDDERKEYIDYKEYGVQFDGTSSAGVRLLDAENLRFTPSSSTEEGIDDFYAIEDSPFHTRKCIREYNDGVATYTFEDTDPEKYNELRASNIGTRMIAFPKFYYKRPDEWTFLVSSEKLDGYQISPMHCKRETINGPFVEYDYVYVSEFMVNSNGDISQPNYAPRTSTTMNTFRQLAWDNGMYVEDIATRSMITILAIIKYAQLDVQPFIGYGHNNGDTTDIQYDDIKGHDGYRTSKTDNTSIKVMDLVDFYANAWEIIEGYCTFNGYIYINNDTKTIVDYPNQSNYNALGWEYTGEYIPSADLASFTNITYNINMYYLLSPVIINGRPNPFGDGYWSSNTDNLLIFGGSGWDKNLDGLFCQASSVRFSESSRIMDGARFIAFD